MQNIIPIRVYRNRLDRRGVKHELTLLQLMSALLIEREFDHSQYEEDLSRGNLEPKKVRDKYKGQFKAWAGHVFEDEDGTRAKANIRGVTVLTYDFDDLSRPFDEVRYYFEVLGWTCLFHTTSSHSIDQTRMRVILPLKEECPAVLFPRLWKKFFDLLGEADTACSDSSRINYLNYQPFDNVLPRSSFSFGRFGLLDWRSLDLPPIEQPKPKAPRVIKVGGAPPTNNKYNESSQAREELGLSLGGRSSGGAIKGVVCPGCGRSSLWWYISTQGQLKAVCNHKNSCGHSTWLDALEAIR